MEEANSSDNRAAGTFRRILEGGADIAGGTTGAAAGLAIAGPAGAFAGAAAGPAVASVMKDVIHRVLSRREEKRVGGVFIAACAAYEELISSGAAPRTDEFFASETPGASSAEEVFEGVVLAAKNEHQERKIPHLGYLMANIAFDATLDASLASWAIRTAEDLTWTQFILLSAIGRKGRFALPEGDYGRHSGTWGAWNVHEQLADLGFARREMVGAPAIKTDRMALALINLNMRELELKGVGRLLYNSMWLDRIPEIDVSQLLASLLASRPADN